jgi:ketosteroid isomerase-like protein
MTAFDATAADLDSVREWVDTFSAHVAAVEFEPAAQQFDPEVVSFSSHRDVVTGIEEFVNEQWRRVWPSMTDFRLETESLGVRASPDRLMAVAMVTWTSTGYAADGTPFDRPGRCTVVLGRESIDAPWRGIHGHFSLKRGVPQQSFGPGGRMRTPG